MENILTTVGGADETTAGSAAKTLVVSLFFAISLMLSYGAFAAGPVVPGQTTTVSDGRGGTWTCTTTGSEANCVHHAATGIGSN